MTSGHALGDVTKWLETVTFKYEFELGRWDLKND